MHKVSVCMFVCVCYLNQGLQATTSKENSERLMNCVALVEKQTQVIVLQLKNKSFFIFFRNFVTKKMTQIGLIFVVEYVSCLLSNLCNSHREFVQSNWTNLKEGIGKGEQLFVGATHLKRKKIPLVKAEL